MFWLRASWILPAAVELGAGEVLRCLCFPRWAVTLFHCMHACIGLFAPQKEVKGETPKSTIYMHLFVPVVFNCGLILTVATSQIDPTIPSFSGVASERWGAVQRLRLTRSHAEQRRQATYCRCSLSLSPSLSLSLFLCSST